ncbi:PLP-dependent aminotransferase family protein [Streptomyces sp. NPDC051322]|uniref:MocR-like transcription factor YczR n=1 Tax=Streptomyces sp. NPDC051322 TaxID=3154645 RepID=UPI00344FDD37
MAAPQNGVAAHRLAQLIGEWRQGEGSAYQLLATSVRNLVQQGRLPVAIRMPAERELAAALTVSRTTVSAAYEQLGVQGYMTARRGSGSYVNRPPGHPASLRRALVPPDLDGAVDLSTAAMSAPEPWLSRALAAAGDELPWYARTQVGSPGGLWGLRQMIAARYEQRGLATEPDQILVTRGATDAYALLLQEFAAAGERIAVESPGCPGRLRALRSNGAHVVSVPLPDEGWSTAAWAGMLRASAPLLACLTPDFHDPTGRLMPEEQRRELVALAASAGVTLLADESMAELSLDPAGPGGQVLPLAASDRGGTVITVGSASKAFWGGLRIGWIRATAELVRRLTDRRAGLNIGPPVLTQLAVRHLLLDGVLADVLAFQRGRARVQRDSLTAAVRTRLPGWTFRVPDGGLALWVRTGGAPAAEVTAAAQRTGVRLHAGPRFAAEGGSLDGFVRLAFAQPPEVVEEAVRRIAGHVPLLGRAGELTETTGGTAS